jgi:acetyl-CoA carboxylase biotin carboxylase subunit
MIEEAPAAILSASVRKRLHRAAVQLLAGIGYRNAGTVEFLYDEARQDFYFMEVNARLQVEHPVSEEITGTDLVRQQLLLATGRAPLLRQKDVKTPGHAIEVRILAEDPDRDFIPTPGRIARWKPPTGEGVRVDSAVVEGSVIPPYYDSMIAKLIVHGRTRDEAIDRLAAALDRYVIEGIPTNIPLLRFIVAHPDYRANRIDTRWLEHTVLPAFRAK